MFPTTKLFLPLPPPGAVRRERLAALLDTAWEERARLLLISAPPGYGKTTLLAGWAAERGLPCAWVSLDEGDNDPARFALLLITALEPHIPGLRALLPVLSAPQAVKIEPLAAELVNQAAQMPGRVLLALDDYHAVTNPAVHALVEGLINHLPPQMTVAVLTREDPPFPLARLRARRQMSEVRARELAFVEDEGASLLNAQSPALKSEQVAALLERTEGWAAGLQLAALILRGHPRPDELIASFSGSHRFVLDYLAGEVLDRLPPELADFLCRSALLDRFNADLCAAALGLEGSRELLARAAAANLFLVPLDDSGGWYRYHHLMAEILRAETPPGERAEIYRRAALWLRGSGEGLEAVRCALESGDEELACEMIRASAFAAVERGLLATALGWLAALKPETLAAQPDLCVFRVWFLLLNGQFHEAAAWMAQIAGRVPPAPHPLAGLMGGLQAWAATLSGHPMDLDRLSEAYALTRGRYPYFAPLLLLAIGQAQRERGDLEGARASFEEGADLADERGSLITALMIRNNLAFLLNNSGERAEAMRLLDEGIRRFTGPDGRPELLAGIPLLIRGIFLYENGELEAARSALVQSLNMVQRLGVYDVLAAPANYALQNLLLDQGRLDEALSVNRDVRRKAARAGLPVVVDGAELTAAWLRLLSGEQAPAERWVAAHPPSGAGMAGSGYAAQLRARLLAAQGQPAQGAELLRPEMEKAQAMGLRTVCAALRVDLAVLHRAAGEEEQAFAELAQAVEAAAGTGYRQPFLRSARELAPLLERLRARFPAFIAGILGQPPQPVPAPSTAPVSPASTAPAVPASPPALVEQLTQREIEILRLVGAGLSNAEIAERLFLTVGTVKWYLNQVFGKLGARRRTEALAAARTFGLL